jgi:hypothetical protein
MPRQKNTSASKGKVVEVLQDRKELNELAADYGLNPNMLRKRKQEFLENMESPLEPTAKRRSFGGRRRP